MEYHKIINWLDNTPKQPSKFKIQNWVRINDDPSGTYNTNIQIKFKTWMRNSSLCDYSDAYILASGTITVAAAGAYVLDIASNRNNKEAIFKNCDVYRLYNWNK